MTQTGKNLTGAQKGAIVCLALGPEEAGGILTALTPQQLEQVTREMVAMSRVESSVVKQVLQEYRMSTGVDSWGVQGGRDTAADLLSKTLGEKEAGTVLERIQRLQEQGGLAELEGMEPRMFANILVDEHPQTIAVILSHLDMKYSSKTLDEMPADLASDVLFRMARMDKINPELLAVLEEGLKSKTDVSLSQEMSAPGDAAKVAKLLTMATGGRDEELLKQIEERDGELASRIQRLMFVFEDLLEIDSKSVQRILREVDSKDLGLALKGASPELKKHIFSNMSSRAAAALEEEIELLGAVRVSDVEDAQQRIMDGVRELEQSGDIVVPREGGDGDEFIS